jgi:putative transposase
MAYRSFGRVWQASTRLDTPPLSNRRHPDSRIAPGFIKGKSAIHLARTYGEQRRNFVGQSFWARGYFVSTVGRDEAVIRNYIRNQEQEDQRLEQMNLWR